MRLALMILLSLCFSPLLCAQEIQLQHRDTLKTNDLVLPEKPAPLIADQIFADTPIPSGMVWAPVRTSNGGKWIAREEGSCKWCARPMTFKQAALDKKALAWWLPRAGLMVADIEVTHHLACFQARTCSEANPLLGQTRAQGYAVAAGLTAVSWLGTAYLRKGDRAHHVGGLRSWWIVPLIGDAASAVGIAANLARR
jgi:hypothetical protein